MDFVLPALTLPLLILALCVIAFFKICFNDSLADVELLLFASSNIWLSVGFALLFSCSLISLLFKNKDLVDFLPLNRALVVVVFVVVFTFRLPLDLSRANLYTLFLRVERGMP